MSRWRESSGVSFGSQIVPPGESSCGNACASSHEVLEVVRRSRRGARAPRARTGSRRRRRRPCGCRRCGRCARGCAPGGRTPAAPSRPARGSSPGRSDELALDLLARVAQVVERLRVEELDPELADDAAPAALELGHRGLVEDLVARQVVDQHISLLQESFERVSSPPSPVSRTSSGRPSARAACSAPARSSAVGSCASQTTCS